MLPEGITDATMLAELARVSSLVDLAGRYNWTMSHADLDVAKKLGLTDIKNYQRYAGQVEMELDWLHDSISVLATFVRHLYRVYNNKEVGQNMSIKQDIDPKQVSSFFVQLHGFIYHWKIDGKDILDATKQVKKHVQYLLEWSNSGRSQQDYIQITEGEPRNKGRPWNGKLILKLLLTIIVPNSERFTPKGKSVTYTGVLVELYNWKNRGHVYEIHRIIELKKIRASIAENPCNLSTHQIIEISLVLHSAHVVPKDQDKILFYVNNYIDWDQFNQLYDLDWMEKGIRNVDAVARKLGPASTRATY